MHLALAAIANFESFKRVGVTFTSSLLATAPLFATGLAIIVLNEKINMPIVIGTILVVLGVVFLSWFRPKKHVRFPDLVFALVGAVFIGIATVVTKLGLNISNLPYSAVAISTTAGVATLFAIISISNKWGTISKNFHDATFFIASGIFIGIAFIIFFTALSIGDVSVVFPLNRTQPLFAMLFAWILFKNQDHITRYTIIGATTIVLGGALVSIGA